MLTQILIILLFIIWIVAGVYITMASLNLGPYNTHDSDSFLRRAYVYSTWAAVIIWLTLFLIIVLIILAGFGIAALFSSGIGEAALASGYTGQSSVSWFSIIFLLIISILLIVTGILSALALTNIEKSPLYQKNKTVTEAYRNCLITMVLTFGSIFLLIVGALIFYLLSFRTTQNLNSSINEYSQNEYDNIIEN